MTTKLIIGVGEWPDVDLELEPNATGLIAVLEELTLHAMTKRESETLHELLEQTKISIEEKWAEWDT